MKKFVLLLILVLSLTIVGCSSEGDKEGNTQQNNNQETSGKEREEDEENKEDEVDEVDEVKEEDEVDEVKEEDSKEDKDSEEVTESEIGKLTVVKKNKEVNEVKESGPFTVEVSKMQVAKLEVKEDYKDMFDDKDVVTVLTLEVSAENDSESTNIIYPDQGIVTTNTKEQVDAHLFLSDDVGGDFIGEVIKKGNIIFILDSDPEEITDFKFTISAPHDDVDYADLGEDIVFELSFK